MVQLENNLRFLANFKYEIKKNVTTDPVHAQVDFQKLIPDIESSAKYQFNSICNETMVGFVQNLNKSGSLTEHPVTCFFAEKDKTTLYENQVGPSSGALVAQDEEYHFIQTG